MISKQERQKILEKILDKEEKITVANVIDKLNKSYMSDIITYTNFLDLKELNLIIPILNSNKIRYEIFSVNENIEKKILVFLPENYKQNFYDIANEYISCIKIKPNVKGKLKHKDYMGAIYSLGVKRDLIGDIFADDECAHIFIMKSIEDYILTNLTSVGNQEVIVDILDIFNDEVKNLDVSFQSIDIIVPSLRVDAILSELYKLSRSIVKDKISKGDLFINSKNMFFVSEQLKEDDIVSFKKCGKFKMGKVLRKTKSENLYVNIKKYM